MNSIISLCFLMSHDFATNVFTFDNLDLVKRQVESDVLLSKEQERFAYYLEEQMVEVVIAITKCNDAELLQKHFQPVTEKIVTYHDEVSDGKAYNDMIRMCEGSEVCFIKPNLFVRQHWLTDLLFYKKAIYNSGAISLLNNLRGYDFLPVMSMEDETSINVFIPKENHIEDWGVLLVKRQHFYFVGALTEEPTMHKCEWVHWQKRAMGLGLVNFCIPTVACFVPFLCENALPSQGLVAVESSIKEMRKMKNYYLPL